MLHYHVNNCRDFLADCLFHCLVALCMLISTCKLLSLGPIGCTCVFRCSSSIFHHQSTISTKILVFRCKKHVPNPCFCIDLLVKFTTHESSFGESLVCTFN